MPHSLWAHATVFLRAVPSPDGKLQKPMKNKGDALIGYAESVHFVKAMFGTGQL
jgi:hypothetical protein